MTTVRTGSLPVYTGALTFEPPAAASGVHQSLNVDDVVHIDADHSDGVIRVRHDKNASVDIFEATDKASGSETMRIDHNGIYRGALVGSSVMVDTVIFGSSETDLETYLIEAAAEINNLETVQQTIGNLVNTIGQTVEAATSQDLGTDAIVERSKLLGTEIANLRAEPLDRLLAHRLRQRGTALAARRLDVRRRDNHR